MSTYLYGLVATSHPARVDGLTGVGAPPAQVRTLVAGDIVAIVSDAPEGLRAKRRDVLAHEDVLEKLCAQGATLPMRFGVVGEDDDAVVEEVSGRSEEYTDLLTRLTGQVEINVKATHHEDEVLRQVLLDDSDLRAYHERIQSDGGGSHEERIAFGEKVANAVEQRAAQDADVLIGHLSRLADRRHIGPPVGETFLNASFLVGAEEIQHFEEAVEALREQVDWLLDLRVRGPLPPYSFTEIHQPEPEIARPG
ncbi:hypothetical protein GIY23_19015 [Allosaccharopolyspora coralli]|uniref:Gas vesicle protein n=1 Tax=Allosaccharopolyspora coralli TaxID=2665642 RepID=A0A5Q3QA17_9PSEU|nr:GvpL/GvpF family gas vesicle protein [Allosaccharopolyspora coralli]QGK71332.1 hypothetical protein GIY23_19015 [Allosaccharopolyspora coralli]